MSNNTIIIGISGPSASGKSLLANTIVKEIGSNEVTVISEDSYYKDLAGMSIEERAKVNFDHPNALDVVLNTIDRQRPKMRGRPEKNNQH